MKTAKTTILFLMMAILFAAMGTASCKEQRVKKIVEEMNKDLPMKLEEGIVLSQAYEDNGFIVLIVENDENVSAMQEIQDDYEAVSKAFETQIKGETAETLASLDEGIKFLVRGTTTGQTIDFVYTVSDLKALGK